MSSIVAINDLDHDVDSRLLLPPGLTVVYIVLDFLDVYFSLCFWSWRVITHLSRSTWAMGTLNCTASRQKTQVQGTDCRLPLFFLVYHHWNTEKPHRHLLLLVCLILPDDPIISIMLGFIAASILAMISPKLGKRVLSLVDLFRCLRSGLCLSSPDQRTRLRLRHHLLQP